MKHKQKRVQAAQSKRKVISSPARAAMCDVLPSTGFVRQPTVLLYIPWGKTTLWEKIKAKEFPAPVKLSKNITAWRVEDIRREIAKLGGQAA